VPGAAATHTRTAAFRQLLLQARPGRRHGLGYSPGTATCHVIAADGTWHRYRPPAPGAERGTETECARIASMTAGARSAGTVRSSTMAMSGRAAAGDRERHAALVQPLDRVDRTLGYHLGPGDQGAVHIRQDRGDRLRCRN
jgi:hypothetical protein